MKLINKNSWKYYLLCKNIYIVGVVQNVKKHTFQIQPAKHPTKSKKTNWESGGTSCVRRWEGGSEAGGGGGGESGWIRRQKSRNGAIRKESKDTGMQHRRKRNWDKEREHIWNKKSVGLQGRGRGILSIRDRDGFSAEGYTRHSHQ